MLPVVLTGIALTIVTLGVYRFWYVTDVRRFLWNNSEVDGDFIEYTGRGVELFIGFLIALAVLLPLYGAIFLIGLATGPIGAVAFQSAATLGIIVLGQYALYRARRYRLTRTIWRGVRFQQTGSGWNYAARSFGWAIAAILTLGLAYPFMRASLERYKMDNTWYGDQKGGFDATGWSLFRRGILLWILAIVALAGPVGAAAYASGLTGDAAKGAAAVAGGAGALFAALVLIVVVPLYQAIEYRWWADGCRVGPATARCDLGLFAFFKVYLGYFGVVLLFAAVVGLAGLGAGLALHAGGLLEAPEPGPAQIAVGVLGAIVYFLAGLMFAALWQLFGVRPIWRKSLQSVEILNLSALMAAQSAAPEANAFGEGVADAIDFGGF